MIKTYFSSFLASGPRSPNDGRHTGGKRSVGLSLSVLSLGALALSACSIIEGDEETGINYLTPAPTEVDLPERPEPPLVPPTPNGLDFPTEVYDWRVIGMAEIPNDPAVATDDQLRVIVGNDTAVEAARSGDTNPWPDGTMLSHLIWNATTESVTEATVPNTRVPGAYVNLTLMVKDSEAYEADGGWAYGLWRTPELVPADAGFDRDCVACHTREVGEANDFVFTRPGAFPTQDAIDAALATPTGLEVPAGILDWRVVGAVKRNDNGQLRVVVGNDAAVDAARAGNTDPWPEGSMLGHFGWAAGTNPDDAAMVAPGAFAVFTLMVRDEEEYEGDGGWAYGAWTTPTLNAPAAADYDRACVACHTERVSDRDFVFTVPGALPEIESEL